MKRFIKEETGEFAIDAIFGITFFMISLIAILFMALIIRVQSNIQYALGQTAKEISGYYYLLDKVGLAAATSGKKTPTDVDSTIQTIVDFSGSAENAVNSTGGTLTNTYNNIQSGNITPAMIEDIKNSASDVNASIESFKAMKSSIEGLNGDSVAQVLSVFAKTGVNKTVSNLVIPIVCRKLMPKYLSGKQYDTIEAYYEATGISDVEFLGSQCLADNRSIKLQITYKLNLEKYTLGFVKTPIYFRQVASTAAWVRPDGENLLALDKLGY